MVRITDNLSTYISTDNVLSKLGIKKHATAYAAAGVSKSISLTWNRTYLIVVREWAETSAVSVFVYFHTKGYKLTPVVKTSDLVYAASSDGFVFNSPTYAAGVTVYELNIPSS